MKVQSTYKLNCLGQYEYFKMFFWSKGKFFDYYKNDVSKLNCIPEDLIVDPENIVDICINFFSKLITKANPANSVYFNNISKKNVIIEKYLIVKEEQEKEIISNLNNPFVPEKLKKEEPTKEEEITKYLTLTKKYNPKDQINIDGFVINNKKDILNYLNIKHPNVLKYILTTEKNERKAKKPFYKYSDTKIENKLARQEKTLFYPNPKKTNELLYKVVSTHEINKETIEDALTHQLFKYYDKDLKDPEKNQFVFDFIVNWDFSKNNTTFLKNLKREFFFDKLNQCISNEKNQVLNYSSFDKVKVRNLFNLFLNKHSLEISTLLQSYFYSVQEDHDKEFDDLFLLLFVKEYPNVDLFEKQEKDYYKAESKKTKKYLEKSSFDDALENFSQAIPLPIQFQKDEKREEKNTDFNIPLYDFENAGVIERDVRSMIIRMNRKKEEEEGKPETEEHKKLFDELFL